LGEAETKENNQAQVVSILGLIAKQVQQLIALIDTPKSSHERLSGNPFGSLIVAQHHI